MRLGPGRVLLAQAGGALAAAVLIGGCGNNYRPVVTPVPASGPPSQPASNAVVVSSPSPTSPGMATIIDYSGDAIMGYAPIGIGPLAFTIDESGSTGYTFNSDHTITNFPVVTDIQLKNELLTTLPSTARPLNILAPLAGMWIGDLDGDVADIFKGDPQTFLQALPMAPASTPVFIAGVPTNTGQRQYVINQNLGPNPSGVECNQASASAPLGSAVPVEISTYTTDVPIPLGHCPVFAVQSTDERRLFVLNRGDDTITVINSQNNDLDQCAPFVNQNGQQVTCHPTLPLSTSAVTTTGIKPPNGTAGMPAIAGPVYAEYNLATEQLVVADYDGGAVSIIDVSLDQYGNDSPTFGTTYTVSVGTSAHPDPASVTVLMDGSRAYTANQGDCVPDCTTNPNGTVTVVNLSSHSVEKTLPVTGVPRTVVSTQNSLFGKVYVASPNSPFLTILQTTTDLIDTAILVQGNIVDVRTTTQAGIAQKVVTYNGGTNISNINFSSRIPGFGQPCNLPPSMMVAKYGNAYTLQDCQTIP